MPRKEHRGRIQAQGDGLEASESWAQDEPLTAKDGRTLLQRLKGKIPKKELKKREKQFDKAEDLINRSESTGGLHARFDKSFQRDSDSDVRVDVEVLGGTAFVCIVFIFLLWLLLN